MPDEIQNIQQSKVKFNFGDYVFLFVVILVIYFVFYLLYKILT